MSLCHINVNKKKKGGERWVEGWLHPPPDHQLWGWGQYPLAGSEWADSIPLLIKGGHA
jgi:hypothetical protein